VHFYLGGGIGCVWEEFLVGGVDGEGEVLGYGG